MTCDSKLYVSSDILIPIVFESITDGAIVSGSFTLIKAKTGESKIFAIDLSNSVVKINSADITVKGKYYIKIEVVDIYGAEIRLTPCPSHITFEP